MTDTIGGNHHVGLQRRKSRSSMTLAKRAAFLDELAASCNVTRAIRAAGVCRDAAYGLRRRDPVFAAAWATAIEEGEQELRALLLSRAMGTADAELIADNPGDADRAAVPAPAMSNEEAIKMLQIVRASRDGRQGIASWRNPRPPVATREAVFEKIAKKLDKVERKLKRDGKL